MEKDRALICDIISEMLEGPDENGIYQTTTACDKLEVLVNDRRVEAIGWTLADDCADLDNGGDPREKDVVEMLERALKDLSV